MNTWEVVKSKVLSIEEAQKQIAIWKLKDQKVVFTNGCFDILHLGHVHYLAEAKSLGNKMVLGLNTDASVKRLKGPERPINNELARALVLASLHCIDAIVFFGEDTPLELIKALSPDILVKGADYKPEEIVGYDVLMSYGGEVKTIELEPGYSTTAVLEKIKGN